MELVFRGKKVKVESFLSSTRNLIIRSGNDEGLEMKVERVELKLEETDKELIIKPHRYIFKNAEGGKVSYLSNEFVAYANVTDYQGNSPIDLNGNYNHYWMSIGNYGLWEKMFKRYYVKNGKVEEVFVFDIADVAYDENVYGSFNLDIKFKPIAKEYGTLYGTRREVMAYGTLYHTDINNNRVEDNPYNLKSLLLNDKQKELKEKLEALLKEAEDLDMKFLYLTEEDAFVAINETEDVLCADYPHNYDEVDDNFEQLGAEFLKESYLWETFGRVYCDDCFWVKKKPCVK